ncbi:single-stranded DNA-binding protein [Collinsella sp. AGMB00827]|uniref:Single-stranded DNA-binding protein n=1 Tax=Collinsella ureilytica TaxID=2869515 RepID=A0ABS7MK94_9ACTN|nr:single-stranded DNA-binding protein [Collinsella urealyticum]MBY4797787.1 single-stranded DNA-binding protein [Collinsella urealyticum]
MSINRVVISGNLTRDPEMRATSGGTQVMSFGVAVNDRRRNQQTGEWEDYPNFVDCTMFGTRAEAVSRYLSKGAKVAIEGKLRYSSWERDGQRRSKLEVVVDEIEFLSRNQQGGQGGYAPQGNYVQQQNSYTNQAPSAPAPAAPVQTPPTVEVYDEDIPF